MTFREWLQSKSACGAAVHWVGDRDLPTAWAECERADWMLWLAAKAGVERKLLVLAACDCANEAWQYCDDETLTAVMLCDQITRDWCDGLADIEDVRAARECADAAAAYAAAAYAAAASASAAAYAADAAYAAAAAADAASYASYADAAAYAAAAAARAKVLSECATLVRARISADLITLS